MPQRFLAWITPVGAPSDAHPEHPIYDPPQIWPDPGRPHPEHPIVIPPQQPGKPPVVIWPSPPHPAHPIAPGGPPGYPAHPIAPGGERPEHPIYYPPIIWPQPPEGGPPIVIDPPHPEHPIVLPKPPGLDDPRPEHPIVIPLPPQIWPRPGHPEHPIVIPPDPPPEGEPKIDWVTGWTEEQGWVVVGIVTPDRPHPSPAGRGRK